jgi:(p)ppGpp synthase/HD superfamily hydrolase
VDQERARGRARIRPEVYYQLKRNVAKKKAEQVHQRVQLGAGQEADRAGHEAEVSVGRALLLDLRQDAREPAHDQIFDLVGFRVVVDTVANCYGALGVGTPTGSRCRAGSGHRAAEEQHTSRCTPP